MSKHASVIQHTHTPHPHAQEKKPLPQESQPSEEALAFSPLFAWPLQWVGMMFAPWRAFLPMAGGGRAGHSMARKAVAPASRSEDSETHYRYLVELPGIQREQLALQFQNRMIMLEIKQDRRAPVRRAFSLPVYTDGSAVTASLADGVLTITIPKTDKPVAPQAHRIEIS